MNGSTIPLSVWSFPSGNHIAAVHAIEMTDALAIIGHVCFLDAPMRTMRRNDGGHIDDFVPIMAFGTKLIPVISRDVCNGKVQVCIGNGWSFNWHMPQPQNGLEVIYQPLLKIPASH